MLKILVIEDNPDDALIMERALKPRAEVEFAESGAEGARRATEGNFDAVILDYRLGDLTGTEVLLRIREKKQDLPVIMASGQGSHFIVARSLALGAREFVNKDDKDFATQLNRALDQVLGVARPANAPTPIPGQDVESRAREVKRMIKELLEASDIINTVGIVGPDGALISGAVTDRSGAEDVTAVLAGTVQMMLSTVAHHLGYGHARSFVASFDKGCVAMASLPGNLVLYLTSSAGPQRVERLRQEIEAAATEIGRSMESPNRRAKPRL